MLRTFQDVTQAVGIYLGVRLVFGQSRVRIAYLIADFLHPVRDVSF